MDKTLQYFPIVFIDTPSLPQLCGNNTHYSMFSFFGSEKNENRKRETQNNKSHHISIKTYRTGTKLYIQYFPIVFIDTPFLPYVGIIHTIACFRSSAPKKRRKLKTENRNNFENGTSLFNIDPCKLLSSLTYRNSQQPIECITDLSKGLYCSNIAK